MTNPSLDALLASLDAAASVDFSKPLRQTSLLMEQEARNRFREERDPWGHVWRPHAEATKEARLRKHNTRTSLLVDSSGDELV